jgi:hypothetical protein
MAVDRETRRLRRGRAVYVTLAVLVVGVLVAGGAGCTRSTGLSTVRLPTDAAATPLSLAAAGQLNIPDGFDLLLPDGSTPTHPATG